MIVEFSEMLIVFTDFLFYDVMIREVDSGQEDCPGVPGFPQSSQHSSYLLSRCPHFLVLKHVNCYQRTGTQPDARTKAKAEIIILRTHSLTLSLPLPSYQTFQNFLGSFAALNHINLSVSRYHDFLNRNGTNSRAE